MPPGPALTSEEVGQWWLRVELARQRRKTESDKWKKLFKAYLPPEQVESDDINSNIHFRNVHLKTAEVWAQLPELKLTPLEPLQDIAEMDPRTGQPMIDPQTAQPKMMAPEEIVAVKRAVLNKLLGRDHANVDHTILEALFDIFATSGIAATKICYESDQPEIPVDVPSGAPQNPPGAVLGLGAQVQPTKTVMQPGPAVSERFRWYRFSPEKLLIPHDWHSTDFDEAPWLGMEFIERLTPQSRKKYKLPDDYVGNVSKDDMLLTDGQNEPGYGNNDLFKGVELWAKASLYDPAVINSQVYRRIVLVDGQKDAAAIYEDSPYQTLGQDGKLTIDSMLGNAIHPITLRVLSDSAYIPADSAFTNPLIHQENTWARQDIQIRDSNVPRFLHANSIAEAIEKLKNAEAGQGAGVDAADLAQGIDKLIAEIPHLEQSASDVQGRQNLKRAIDETLGISANQAGTLNATNRSATEVATVQRNISVRLKQEQNQLLSRILQGVRKFDALVQRYMDAQDYVEIVGRDGARKMVAYTQAHLAGRYAFDAYPDSQLSIDAAERRKITLDMVNFMAKSPYMDQAEIARVVCNEFGFDPARMIKQPQPAPPPPPNVSFRFSGPDLSIPEVRALLATQSPEMAKIFGGPPSPEAALAAQQQMAKNQPHGGPADKADVLSKHSGEETGNMPGRAPHGAPPAHATPGRVQ
jgi:hypothetical protein